MRKRLQIGILATFALGAAAALLRLWLLNTGIDEKGLLVSSHPGIWLSYVLTAVMAAGVIALTWPITFKPRYNKMFPGSLVAAAGCIAAAIGLIVFGCQALAGAADTLRRICGIVGLLSAVAMLGIAFFRFKGLRPNFLLLTLVCIFFMLALYCNYRQWSREPQLSVYVYAMLAMVCSLLACYYRTALDSGAGSIRGFLGFSLAALFFCFAALPGSDTPVLYLGFGLYFLGELTALRLPKRTRQKPIQGE